MKRRGGAVSIAFRDVLYLIAFMYLIILTVVLPALNPPAVDSATHEPPGNLIVSIAWPPGNQDVDLWVLAPGDEKAVGYSNKGGAVWNLLRDDLGNINDAEPFNREDAYSRGLPAGEYVVNLHGYRLTIPQKVSVEVGLASNGATNTLLKTVVDLAPGQELTVVRFRLDADGRVVPGSVSRVFAPLRAAKEG